MCVCVCVCVCNPIQHAMRMHRVMLPSVTRPAVPYFLTLYDAGHYFRVCVCVCGWVGVLLTCVFL